jgi:flavodoxin
LDLLVVGSATRAFRPTPAMAALLKSIPRNVLKGVKVAAFDTRMAMEDVESGFLRFMAGRFGYAAGKIAARLKKAGGTAAIAPEGFIVKGEKGPMRDGELERAEAWARKMI